MAAKKKVEVAATGTAVLDVAAEIKKELAEMSSRISAPSGDVIKVTQDKNFVLPNGTKSPGPLSVVIIDFAAGSFFHDRPYKKGEEAPPACFALGLEPNKLVPDASSPDKQADTCLECPNNEWGSKGNGKACDNLRFLAVVEPGDGDDVPKDIMVIKVSPTGIRAFDAYVDTIKTQFETTPIGVVTEIYFDPNLTYGSLRFGSPTPNKFRDEHFALKKKARARLLTPPDVSRYTPPAKPGKGRK